MAPALALIQLVLLPILLIGSFDDVTKWCDLFQPTSFRGVTAFNFMSSESKLTISIKFIFQGNTLNFSPFVTKLWLKFPHTELFQERSDTNHDIASVKQESFYS